MFSDRNQQPDKVPMEELPGTRPMVFIPNKGQTNEDILYYSYGGRTHAAFTEDRILFNSDLAAPALKFVNRSPKINIIGSKECHETFSYYIGNSPANWHTGLTVYHEIIYKELWDGIDLKFSIALDSSSHAVIAGYTTATDFPVKNAFQPALKGQQDAFIAKINPEGLGAAGLIFGTYAGGTLPLGNITLANCVSIGNSSDPILW